MRGRLRQWLLDDSGQDLVEYGLLAALISVAAVVAMTSAGSEAKQLWDTVLSGLQDLL
jgi:Flp pilus assembly pilin Flp